MQRFISQHMFFLLFIAGIASRAQAQPATGNIRGHMQSETGEALAGITIRLENTSYGTATDKQGDFDIKNIPAGRYTLLASGIGYEDSRQEISVKPGETIFLRYQLNSKTSELSEVIITSGRSQAFASLHKIDVPARDLPLTSSAVSLQTIEQRGIDDLGEAMKNVSGIRANNTYGGFQHFTLRGFNNFVLLVDGVRDERHNISTSAPSTNLANVERIEVLKGPASVLFGHSALGGIINIVRKQPSEQFKANFSAAYGSFNTRRIRAGAGGPVSSQLRYRVDVGMSETEGFRRFGTSTNNAYLALAYTPTAKDNFYLTIGVNKDVYDTDTGIPVLEGGRLAPGMDRNTRYNDPADFLKHTRSDFQLRYVRQLGSRLSLSNHLSYYDDNINYFSTEQLSFNAAQDSLTRSSPLYFNHLTRPLQNQLELTGDLHTGRITQKLLAGYSLSLLDRKTYGGDVFGPAKFARVSLANPVLNQGYISYVDTRYRATDETVHGLYIQDWLAFSDKLKGLVGLRYDIFKGTYYTNQVDGQRNVREEGPKTDISVAALTYRAGLVYQPAALFSLYGSYSTYFKPSRRIAPNGETFDPETGYQAEAGSRLTFSTRLAVNLAAYYMRKDNQVESLPGGVLRRIGSADSKGFEVDIQSSPLAGLDLNAGYTFTAARYLPFRSEDTNPVAGNRAIFAPAHMLNAWIHYELQQRILKGLSLGAGINTMSKTFTNSANTYALPGYVLADAAIGYRLGQVALRLNVNNIANVKYFSNAILANQFYPGATRNYLLSLQYNL
jgi:iron complex outermembrane recepter protein